MSQGGYNPNNNRVGTGRDGVGMRKCLRSVNLRVKSSWSRTIPTLPIFSLELRKVEINWTFLEFKLKVRGEPWLSLTFPSDLSQKASRKVKENRGKSRRNPNSTWFLISIFVDFWGPRSQRSRWIGDLLKSRSWFSVGIETSVPTYLAYGCTRPWWW